MRRSLLGAVGVALLATLGAPSAAAREAIDCVPPSALLVVHAPALAADVDAAADSAAWKALAHGAIAQALGDLVDPAFGERARGPLVALAERVAGSSDPLDGVRLLLQEAVFALVPDAAAQTDQPPEALLIGRVDAARLASALGIPLSEADAGSRMGGHSRVAHLAAPLATRLGARAWSAAEGPGEAPPDALDAPDPSGSPPASNNGLPASAAPLWRGGPDAPAPFDRGVFALTDDGLLIWSEAPTLVQAALARAAASSADSSAAPRIDALEPAARRPLLHARVHLAETAFGRETALDSIEASITFDPAVAALVADVNLTRSANAAPLTGGASHDAWSLLPGATIVALAVRANPIHAVQAIEAALAGPSAAGPTDLSDLLEALFERSVGDLAPAFGSGLALGVTRQRAASDAAQAAPAITLGATVRDRAMLDAALQRVIRERLAPPLRADAEEGERAQNATHRLRANLAGGVTAHVVEPPAASRTLERFGGTVLPGYAFVGDTLLVTTGADLLATAAENREGAARSLAASPRFAAARALGDPARRLAELHIDGAQLAELLVENAPSLGAFLASTAADGADADDSPPDPPPAGGGARAYERWQVEFEAYRQRQRDRRAQAEADARARVEAIAREVSMARAVRAALWDASAAAAPGAAPAPTAPAPGQLLRARVVVEIELP